MASHSDEMIDSDMKQYQEGRDDIFHLANRTFYTTCHKISRQNNSTLRKRPPYTFVENWLIHTLFSKSQQILLRFPVIHPKVMLTEGDFIYTPHQMISEGNSNNEMNTDGYDYYSHEYRNDEDDEEYYNDDTFIIGDEGVVVMSASDVPPERPLVMMDENAWMGHSKYNGNGSTLHVVNPDLTEEEERPPRKRQMFCAQLQMVREEEEDEGEEPRRIANNLDNSLEGTQFNNLTMSPEIIHRYLSADIKQMKSIISGELEESNIGVECSDRDFVLEGLDQPISNKSYQSLSDIISDEDEISLCSHQISNNTATTSYGTLFHRLPEQAKLTQVSTTLVNATWAAMNLAKSYHEDDREKTALDFAGCILKIWKELVLGVGSILDWRGRIKLQTAI
ncbi:hypothetical protein BY458DRAFT_513042 [Sporodiniella umbellata]|nr:hypothetical protein BY458DRAFT_513042 [Sporodiniella umbellata]